MRADSFDHLVGKQKKRVRNRETERLGGLEIDDQFVFFGELERQLTWFRALQDLVDVGGGTPILVGQVRAIRHQAARLRELAEPVDRRQTQVGRHGDEPCAVQIEYGVPRYIERLHIVPCRRRERWYQLGFRPHL